MRLFVSVWCVVMLGLLACSEGAPQGGKPQQMSLLTSGTMSRDHSSNDILPIIAGALTRSKRGSSSNRPYSNYRPRTMGRYRYPVYRKRSSAPVPTYDYDYEGNYLVDVDDLQQKAHEKRFPMIKKDSVFNLANSPYNLHTMGRLYEVGKRGSSLPVDVYDLEAMGKLYEVGKRNPYDLESMSKLYEVGKRSSPAPYDLETMSKLYEMGKRNPYDIEAMSKLYEVGKRNPYDLESMSKLYEVGKRSAPAPLDAREFYNAIDAVRRKKDILETSENSSAEASMIRRKRDMPVDRVGDETTNDTNVTEIPESSKSDTSNSPTADHEGSWVRQKKSAKDDNLNELLTRKYFETFAQSVGDRKKKRMAYAQFTADKRSPGVEEMLSNPTMLKYMQDQLKELEAQVTEQAEEDLQSGDGHGQDLLSNVVVRLDALERMREALHQLGVLQQQVEDENDESDEDGTENISTHGQQTIHKRAIKEGCPEEERLMAECMEVSRQVGDSDGDFLQPCIKHQVCFMCGSSQGISGHECDAVLSSGLEAACSGNIACQGAAGETFDILSSEKRQNNTAPHCSTDSCLNHYLQHR